MKIERNKYLKTRVEVLEPLAGVRDERHYLFEVKQPLRQKILDHNPYLSLISTDMVQFKGFAVHEYLTAEAKGEDVEEAIINVIDILDTYERIY